jgi:asparagine N-glycosylation enzyme membrane subunit Stt3
MSNVKLTTLESTLLSCALLAAMAWGLHICFWAEIVVIVLLLALFLSVVQVVANDLTKTRIVYASLAALSGGLMAAYGLLPEHVAEWVSFGITAICVIFFLLVIGFERD